MVKIDVANQAFGKSTYGSLEVESIENCAVSIEKEAKRKPILNFRFTSALFAISVISSCALFGMSGSNSFFTPYSDKYHISQLDTNKIHQMEDDKSPITDLLPNDPRSSFLLNTGSKNIPSKSFPIGVNLSPVGGDFYNLNWNAVSTYVFIDLFKHCSAPYIRSTNNNGVSFGYLSNTQIQWRLDGYTVGLPFYTVNRYWVAMCDIGQGGNYIKNGTYVILWEGTGVVNSSPLYTKILSSDIPNKRVLINVHITGNQGLNIRILKSNYSDPVHNVRLVPVEYESTYNSQIFQNEFLNILKPYDHIRFTGWQKISCSTTVTGKKWQNRTTTSTFSQHGTDGIALEYMINLVQTLKSTVKSVWFSFPLLSANYNQQAITLLKQNLPEGLTIYYEAGCPETCGDSDRHVEALQLYDQFSVIFGNANFILKPSASVFNSAYISYLTNTWFGKTNFQRVAAVAVPGQFGRSIFSWDGYNSYGEWDMKYANYSDIDLSAELRRSVIVAEIMLNQFKNKLLSYNPNIEFISFLGGPYFNSASYGYRAGKSSILSCVKASAYPCKWANTNYNFPDITSVQAALPAMTYNATLEQILEDKFIQIQGDTSIQDLYLDLLRRWEGLGGGLFVGSLLVKPVIHCPFGGKSCGDEGIFPTPDFSNYANIPKYMAPILYQSGTRGNLPFTSRDIPRDPVSTKPSSCHWGTWFNESCVCFAGYGGDMCNARVPKMNDCNNDTGINLAGVVDWSSEWAFVNLFYSSRAWITQDFIASAWDTKTPQYLRHDGYPSYLPPTQTIGSMMMRDLRNHMRNGTFICLYDGDGVITFSMDIRKIVYGVGRIEVTIQPSTGLNNGAFLTIERTNPDDPIRNIRFIMPGFEDTYEYFPFHPLFLHTISNYKTIRFMDWANTNSVTYGNWSERSTPNTTRTYHYGTTGYESHMPGVSIEHMVLLVNTIGANPWFNMPHMCTDDFVYKYAMLVKSTLRPDVKIYVEYSNEVWGTLFSGGQYAQRQGLKLGLSTDGTVARLCYYGLRSSQIFTIWKNVFGSDSNRLELVLASQSVNPDVSRIILQCGRRNKEATALAIAPYFGQYRSSIDKNLGIFMNTTLPAQIQSIYTSVRGHYNWAKRYNLTLITYESGQGLQGSGVASDLAIQANRDLRMRGLYRDYFNMLRRGGMRLMMQFSSAGLFNTGACWGLIEATDMNPEGSPKYLGLKDYISEHQICQPPSESNVCPQDCSHSGYCRSDGKCECYYGNSGEFCEISTYTEHTDLCGYKCTFDQGVCVPDYINGNDRYWKCACKEGYYGVECGLFNCTNSCNFHGKCIDNGICSCYSGYSGASCEVDCGCNGHGVCASDMSSCQCDVGYKWSNTNGTCIPDCKSGTCQDAGQSICEECLYGTCLDGECLCWAGYSGSGCDVAITKTNTNSRIGVNVGGVSYYSTELAFVDVMKMSSDWISLNKRGWSHYNPWGNGLPIHLREDGYPAYLEPGQVLGKLMLRDIHLHAPSGRYVCLYDGEGVLEFDFDSMVLSEGKGRIEIWFQPTTVPGCTAAYCGDNGIFMTIVETNPVNPIRNIRILMPGYEHQHEQLPFHPWFLKNLEQFSTIRFMGWQNINSNDRERTWNDRTTPQSASFSQSVPIEYMIQLANILGVNPWICIPHLADDDYIRNFALLVKQELRPDLKVYVEYSNEVWNTFFSQGKYAQQQGLALGLSTNAYEAQYRFHSQRSVEIFSIWKTVFSGEDSSRIVRVLSTWTISPTATTTILTWKSAYKNADMIAIAPYFDCGDLGSDQKAASTALKSVSDIITICLQEIPNISSAIKSIVTIARKYNLTIGTYEAGQSLVESRSLYTGSETAGLTDLFIKVNRDSRMKTLYQSYIQTMLSSGALSDHPLIQFSSCGTYTKYGSWGVIEFTGQPYTMTPKYQALLEFKALTSPLQSPCGISAQVNRYGLGVGVSNFFGFPAVTSPRSGDIWVAGKSQSVIWNLDGELNDTISIFLWKQSPCDADHSNTPILTIGVNIKKFLGKFSFQLSSGIIFDKQKKYYIEIRGLTSSNFSEFFSVTSPYFLNNVAYHCCYGVLVPSGTCNLALSERYDYPLQDNSSWANKNLFKCPTNTNMKAMGLSQCTLDTNGCRNYRTINGFKPVTDCVAQSSPYPISTNFTWDLQSELKPSNIAACKTFLFDGSSTCASSVTDPYCYTIQTLRPSTYPTRAPSKRLPSANPTRFPSPSPTRNPSSAPSLQPSKMPSAYPTRIPSKVPTAVPTTKPSTLRPSLRPSQTPTMRPTAQPSTSPSRQPSVGPSLKPSRAPTQVPSKTPTRSPSFKPSMKPSTTPSSRPTSFTPTLKPTARGTRPSFQPTMTPTVIGASS